MLTISSHVSGVFMTGISDISSGKIKLSLQIKSTIFYSITLQNGFDRHSKGNGIPMK